MNTMWGKSKSIDGSISYLMELNSAVTEKVSTADIKSGKITEVEVLRKLEEKLRKKVLEELWPDESERKGVTHINEYVVHFINQLKAYLAEENVFPLVSQVLVSSLKFKGIKENQFFERGISLQFMVFDISNFSVGDEFRTTCPDCHCTLKYNKDSEPYVCKCGYHWYADIIVLRETDSGEDKES